MYNSYMYVCIYVRMYVSIHICNSGVMERLLNTLIVYDLYMYMCIHVRTYVSIYMYVCIYVRMYVSIHICNSGVMERMLNTLIMYDLYIYGSLLTQASKHKYIHRGLSIKARTTSM